MSKYPAQIDDNTTLPKIVDNLSLVRGDTVNRLRAAILATESELGVKPSGVYSTVRARLDSLETAINALLTTDFEGDLDGYLFSPTVIGLQDRPVSDVQPNVNQVLTWDGIAWVPGDLDNVNINILPSSLTLPTDVVFLAGDDSTNSSDPTRVGARVVNMDPFPVTYIDGRLRSMKFKVQLEVTNAAATGWVQLKDLTSNAIITGSTLSTSSISSVELSADILSGDSDGYMRIDQDSMYEVQIFITGGNPEDLVICRNARIEVKYSPPLLVTTILPIVFPNDIQFIAGTELTGSTTPTTSGRRTIDMDFYPQTLTDGRIRLVNFVVDAEISTVGTTGIVQLFDVTHNVAVTNAQFNFTDTLATEITASLTVGSAAGNLRNDEETMYEVRIWKTGGSVADRVICNNARVVVIYT